MIIFKYIYIYIYIEIYGADWWYVSKDTSVWGSKPISYHVSHVLKNGLNLKQAQGTHVAQAMMLPCTWSKSQFWNASIVSCAMIPSTISSHPFRAWGLIKETMDFQSSIGWSLNNLVTSAWKELGQNSVRYFVPQCQPYASQCIGTTSQFLSSLTSTDSREHMTIQVHWRKHTTVCSLGFSEGHGPTNHAIWYIYIYIFK